jgi:hypothetical protein
MIVADIARRVKETLYAFACGWDRKGISSESCEYWKSVFMISPEFARRY